MGGQGPHLVRGKATDLNVSGYTIAQQNPSVVGKGNLISNLHSERLTEAGNPEKFGIIRK